jgi:DNA primase
MLAFIEKQSDAHDKVTKRPVRRKAIKTFRLGSIPDEHKRFFSFLNHAKGISNPNRLLFNRHRG